MPVDLLIGHREEDGSYTDDEGVNYDDAEQYLETRVLGFCPCGKGTILEYVLGSLELIDWKTIQHEKNVPWDTYFKLWRSKCNFFFGNEMAEDFMWHFLDREDYTDHGGSVPGWLNDKGFALRDAIRQVLEEQDD
jgi:hypothetical protein